MTSEELYAALFAAVERAVEEVGEDVFLAISWFPSNEQQIRDNG